MLFTRYRGEFTSKLLPIGNIIDDVRYMHHHYHGVSRLGEFAYHLFNVVPRRLWWEPWLHLVQVKAGSELGGGQGHGCPMTDAMGNHHHDLHGQGEELLLEVHPHGQHRVDGSECRVL